MIERPITEAGSWERPTNAGDIDDWDEWDDYEEDGPMDLEDQLEQALDRAFPPKKASRVSSPGR